MFSPGLDGVTAFRTTIAEPDRQGGKLRYRGVDVTELAGRVNYRAVWSLLVTGDFRYSWPESRPLKLQARTGNIRVDAQANVALLGAELGLAPVIDTEERDVLDSLARVTGYLHSFIAQAARGDAPAVPQKEISAGESAAARFMIEWQGDPDPLHVEAVENYWITAAEHGANASTFTSRVITSTGADVSAAISGAIGALSGPLHGGAPSRALDMVDAVMRTGDAEGHVRDVLDRGGRLMGFGHPVYRAEDPRARILRDTAERLRVPKFEAALAVEKAALAELQNRKPDRVLATNVDFWAAVVLDYAEIPPELLTPLFACARAAGWSAHVLEQTRDGKIFRPSAKYEGDTDVTAQAVPGWQAVQQ